MKEVKDLIIEAVGSIMFIKTMRKISESEKIARLIRNVLFGAGAILSLHLYKLRKELNVA